MNIQVKNFSFFYDDLQVLNNLNFTINEGEFVSFIGPSGCGKTTLLKLIGGIRKGYEGTLINNFENVSFVFQHDSLLEWRKAYQNLFLPFEMKKEKIESKHISFAYDILQKVGLKGYEEYFPDQLSGGMKKRVEIARALISKPDLLILDEPFSSLDIITREKLNVLVKKIALEYQITVILVTHSVEEAVYFSDRVFIMGSTPSEITGIYEVRDKIQTIKDQYLLSDDEKIIESQIRNDAKVLWNSVSESQNKKTDAVYPGKKKKSGASSKDDIRKRVPVFRKLKFSIVLNFMLFLGVLTLIKYFFKVQDVIFPYPHKIIIRFFQTLGNGFIFHDLFITIFESSIGFLIAFVLTLFLGVILAKFKLVNNLIMPYLIAFNTIPSVALAPFLVLWFGFGLTPKIIISVIVIFFPMLINNISSIKLANEDLFDLIQFYKPGKLKSFVKFEFPKALPMIFSGVKVSITLSVIGAVVGEFVSGADGLGSLVRFAKANFDLELMFVGLLWLIILGLSYFKLASFIYGLVTRKK